VQLVDECLQFMDVCHGLKEEYLDYIHSLHGDTMSRLDIIEVSVCWCVCVCVCVCVVFVCVFVFLRVYMHVRAKDLQCAVAVHLAQPLTRFLSFELS
jgi:hypothetical protein